MHAILKKRTQQNPTTWLPMLDLRTVCGMLYVYDYNYNTFSVNSGLPKPVSNLGPSI